MHLSKVSAKWVLRLLTSFQKEKKKMYEMYTKHCGLILQGLFHSCEKCVTIAQYVLIEKEVSELNFRSLAYLDHITVPKRMCSNSDSGSNNLT